MKVKMLTTYAGPLGTFNAGDEPDVSPEIRAALIKAGAVAGVPPPETMPAPETESVPETETQPDPAPPKPTTGRTKKSKT